MNIKVGDIVRLKHPFKGYDIFEIIGKQCFKWRGKCSSGMEIEFYSDEIEALI